MTGLDALSDQAFRDTVRAFLHETYPEALRSPSRRLRWHEVREWYLLRAERGWTAPGWPAEHGGMGLSSAKQLIFIEEQERHGVARAPDQGVVMVGPLLIRYGSDAQRAHFLPRILSWEHIWCQGYSEPGAGSDLASLRTRADDAGDHYVVNGQKIWTTLAQDATHMFVLVRTDFDAPRKQQGISFLLMDLDQPGITIRPIRNIAGDEEFCEVFFDDVRVPKGRLVGEENDGWRMAKALLGFERLFVGSPRQAQNALGRLEALARARGLEHEADFEDRFAQLSLDVADLAEAYEGFADQVRAGEPLGADVSWLKIWSTETYDRIAAFCVEVAGPEGALVGGIDAGNESVDPLGLYYAALPTTIYGGSNEIQRNILAKQVLRLPE
jgi:alkylation response protein AidB-like acyl-CoA dehydrogenase